MSIKAISSRDSLVPFSLDIRKQKTSATNASIEKISKSQLIAHILRPEYQKKYSEVVLWYRIIFDIQTIFTSICKEMKSEKIDARSVESMLKFSDTLIHSPFMNPMELQQKSTIKALTKIHETVLERTRNLLPNKALYPHRERLRMLSSQLCLNVYRLMRVKRRERPCKGLFYEDALISGRRVKMSEIFGVLCSENLRNWIGEYSLGLAGVIQSTFLGYVKLVARDIFSIQLNLFCHLDSLQLSVKKMPNYVINFRSIIAKFCNCLVQYIQYVILKYVNGEDRCKVTFFFLCVRDEIYELLDFQSLRFIQVAFESMPIKRLKCTWNILETLIRELNHRNSMFQSLMTHMDNFRNLRQKCRELKNKPFIPSLEIFNHDASPLHENGRFVDKDEIVDFSEVRSMGMWIEKILTTTKGLQLHTLKTNLNEELYNIDDKIQNLFERLCDAKELKETDAKELEEADDIEAWLFYISKAREKSDVIIDMPT